MWVYITVNIFKKVLLHLYVQRRKSATLKVIQCRQQFIWKVMMFVLVCVGTRVNKNDTAESFNLSAPSLMTAFGCTENEPSQP